MYCSTLRALASLSGLLNHCRCACVLSGRTYISYYVFMCTKKLPRSSLYEVAHVVHRYNVVYPTAMVLEHEDEAFALPVPAQAVSGGRAWLSMSSVWYLMIACAIVFGLYTFTVYSSRRTPCCLLALFMQLHCLVVAHGRNHPRPTWVAWLC